MIVEDLAKKAEVEIQPEVSDWTQKFHMIQGGSPETEVMEFIYGLTQLVKPDNILETGTYAGWSAAVMGYAAPAAKITTLEIDEHWVNESKALHQKLGLTNIEIRHQKSLEYEPDRDFGLMFLDSEPDIRFKELRKFYPRLLPGGFIMIHDLHNHLGFSRQYLHEMEHWPFGSFKPQFGDLILGHELSVINFNTPRGFTLMQKFDPQFMSYKYLTGKEPK